MKRSSKTSAPLRPTIHDVARLAGVSKSTVSRVLNDRGYASPEAIERVNKAIKELNYVPHSTARGLVSRRTNNLGLAVNDMSTLFLPALLTGIEGQARERNYNLLIAAIRHSRTEEGPTPLGVHNTDGIIVYADSFNDEQLFSFHKQDFPVVLIHREPPQDVLIPFVNIENEIASRQIVEHLIQVHRCRRIAHLRGPRNQNDAVERERGYLAALKANDIPHDPKLIKKGGFSSNLAKQAVREWIEARVEIDAIFAGDDESARAAIRTLKKQGILVPEEVAVVGFDDDHLAEQVDPALTTVSVPSEKLGQEAVKRLIGLINQEEVDSVVFPTEVIIRRSCGCAYQRSE